MVKFTSTSADDSDTKSVVTLSSDKRMVFNIIWVVWDTDVAPVTL